MAEEMKRIEVGFAGGQVMSARSPPVSEALREALPRPISRPSEAASWHELEAEDGAISLDLRQVVFVRGRRRPAHDRLLGHVRKLAPSLGAAVVGRALCGGARTLGLPVQPALLGRGAAPADHPRAAARDPRPGGRASACWRSAPGPATTRSTWRSGSAPTGRSRSSTSSRRCSTTRSARARERGLWNVNPTRGDAQDLPLRGRLLRRGDPDHRARRDPRSGRGAARDRPRAEPGRAPDRRRAVRRPPLWSPWARSSGARRPPGCASSAASARGSATSPARAPEAREPDAPASAGHRRSSASSTSAAAAPTRAQSSASGSSGSLAACEGAPRARPARRPLRRPARASS